VVEGKESFTRFPPERNGPVFFPSVAALAPPVVNVIKHFFPSSLTKTLNKLERSPVKNPFKPCQIFAKMVRKGVPLW
jgi:hypothetical protein